MALPFSFFIYSSQASFALSSTFKIFTPYRVYENAEHFDCDFWNSSWRATTLCPASEASTHDFSER